MISAVVIPGPQEPPEIRSFLQPRLEPGGVLLRTLGSEVCGTDVHIHAGRLAEVPYPIIPGHVSVGEVVEIRPRSDGYPVRNVTGGEIRVGQIVTFLDVYGTCGRCWYCTVAHATTRCPDRKVYGVTLSSVDGLFGGWSEYIYLRPGVHIAALPERLDWRLFMAGGCGLPTALHGMTLAEVAFGDTVVVQGSGPVGLCASILAQLRGAGQVIVLGGPESRLRTATQLGADRVVDVSLTSAEERLEIVREATGGRGADVTVEAAGVAEAVHEGMALTRDSGRYVVVGQYTDGGDILFNPHSDLNRKHIDIRGCWGTDVGHLHRALSVLSRYEKHFSWRSIISAEYSLADASVALDDVAKQRVTKALIVPG